MKVEGKLNVKFNPINRALWGRIANQGLIETIEEFYNDLEEKMKSCEPSFIHRYFQGNIDQCLSIVSLLREDRISYKHAHSFILSAYGHAKDWQDRFETFERQENSRICEYYSQWIKAIDVEISEEYGNELTKFRRGFCLKK